MRLIDADKLQKAIPAEEDNITGMSMTYDEMEAYNDGIDEQWKKIVNAPTIEPEQHWIPCSERLPVKDGEMYLVTISDGSVYSFALQWDINRKRWYLSFLNDGEILIEYIDDVIAWMPLPPSYKGDET